MKSHSHSVYNEVTYLAMAMLATAFITELWSQVSCGCLVDSVVQALRCHFGMQRGWPVGASARSAWPDANKAYVKPDVFAFSAAMSACEEGSQWEQALALLG